MIIRVFRPTIHPGKEQEFEAFLQDVPPASAPAVGSPAGDEPHCRNASP